ncbi:unnamed protein product [Ectocarpus fasciculatus]
MSCCGICSSDNAAYRCPQCDTRYCSVPCCRDHKESCNKERSRDRSDDPSDNMGSEGKEIAAGDTSFSLLTEAQKLKLLENDRLKSALRSKRLRDVLEDIDSAPDRQKRLRVARMNPEFEEFVQQLLGAVE